jgi:cytochrome c-type biogenesis protein CcmH/NrfF
VVKRTWRGLAHASAGSVLALTLSLVAPWAGVAQAADAKGWAYDLANEMMSPYCPGRSIADCPSPQAQTLRMWLIVQESAGRAKADVEQELVERYGESMLGAPRAKGVGLTAYALPAVAFVAGGALLVWFLRKQTRGRTVLASAAPSTSGASAAKLDPELERRVDEELSR